MAMPRSPHVAAPRIPPPPAMPRVPYIVYVAAGFLALGAGWWAYATGDWLLVLLAVGGLLLVGLLLLGVRQLFLARRRRQERHLQDQLNGGGHERPADAPAYDAAQNEDLARKFEEGLEKFRAAGKSVYDLPWYLIVGEPGGGKTEAMRHSGLGFPPGLHDKMQGAGGTYSMSWWFTNHAVMIDTAGRLVFGDLDEQGSLAGGYNTVWVNFLDTLKNARKDYPINGLLLVIPATSLLADPPELIDTKAALIEKNLRMLRDRLGVRFPVFVLVTKCDRMTGFKSFFDSLDDPVLEQQMLGWSNDAPLDAPPDLQAVGRHLDAVGDKLKRRRTVALAQQKPTGNERRLDDVDELYDLPDAFRAATDNLQRYLELIFASGQWTTPLFLRGVYFTSAMREGDALDTLVSQMTGMPPEHLPEGRHWSRDKAYFLRDVFTKKAFREKGLVTASDRAGGIKRRRRLTVGLTSLAALLLLGGLFGFGTHQLNNAVLRQGQFWHELAERFEGDRPPTVLAANGTYAGDENGLEELHAAAPERLKESVTAPGLFKIPALFAGDQLATARSSAAKQRAAYRGAFRQSVAQPLVDATGAAEAPIESLAHTLVLLRAAETQRDSADWTLGPIWSGILPAEAMTAVDVTAYDNAFKAAHGLGGDSPEWEEVETTLLGRSRTTSQVGDRFVEAVDRRLQNVRLETDLDSLASASEEFEQAETAIGELIAAPPTTEAEYANFREKYQSAVERLTAAGEKVKTARAAVVGGGVGGDEGTQLADALAAEMEARRAEMERPLALITELSDAPKDQPLGSTYDRIQSLIASRKTDLEREAQEAATQAGRLAEGPAGLDESGGARWRRRLADYEAVATALASLEELVANQPADETLATRLGDIANTTAASAAAASAEPAKRAWEAVVHPARNHAAVRRTIEALPADAAAMKQAVASSSAAAEPTVLPPLPLAAAGGGADPAYDASAVAAMSEDWSAAQETLTNAATGSTAPEAPPLLDPPALIERMKERRDRAILPYLADYAAHWQGELARASSPQPTSWNAELLESLEADRLRRSVESFAQTAGRVAGVSVPEAWESPASQAVGEVKKLAQEAAAWRDDFVGGSQLNDRQLERLGRYRNLSSNRAEALNALRDRVSPGQYIGDYLTFSDQTLAERYYRDLSVALLRSLAEDAPRRQLSDIDVNPNLLRDLRFPMVGFVRGGDAMTLDEMRQLVERDLNPLVEAEADVQQHAAGIADGLGAEAAEAFRQVYSFREQRLADAKAVFDWLEASPVPRFRISVPSREAQVKEFQNPAATTFDWIAVQETGEMADIGLPPDAPSQVTPDWLDVTMGRELGIWISDRDLRHNSETGGERVLQPESAQWAVLEWIDRYGVPAGEGAEAGTVRLKVWIKVGAEDLERPLWLDIEFSKPLPQPLLDRIGKFAQ